MITQDTTIKIGVPVTALISLVSYGFWWGAANLATKADMTEIHNHQQEAYVELMIQLTELQVRPFEEPEAMLTPEKLREYEQLKAKIQRLLEERDKLVGR